MTYYVSSGTLNLTKPKPKPFGWYSLPLPTAGWPGWVDVGGWSHTEINVPHCESNVDVVTHPSTNRAQRRVTLLMCTMPLPLNQATTTVVGLGDRSCKSWSMTLQLTGGHLVFWCMKWWLVSHHLKQTAKMIYLSRFSMTTSSILYGWPKKRCPYWKGWEVFCSDPCYWSLCYVI